MVALVPIPTPTSTLSLASNPFTCPANPSATCTIRTTQTQVRLAAVTIPPGTEALSSYRSKYSASSSSKYNFDQVIFPDDEQPSNIVYDSAGNPIEVLTFFKDDSNPGITVSVPCCGDFNVEAYDVEWGNRAAIVKEQNATATGTGTVNKGEGCTEIMSYTVVPKGQPFSENGDLVPENNCVQPPSTVPFAPTRGVPVTKTVVRQLVPPTDPPGNDGGDNGGGDDGGDDGGSDDGGDDDGGDDDGGDDDGNPTPQPIETGGGNNGGSNGGSNGGGSNNGGSNNGGSNGGGSTGGGSDGGHGSDHGGSGDNSNGGGSDGSSGGGSGDDSTDNGNGSGSGSDSGNGNGSDTDSGNGNGSDTGSGSDNNNGNDDDNGTGSGNGGSEGQTSEPPAPTSGAENGAGLAFGKGISWVATLGLAFVVAVGML